MEWLAAAAAAAMGDGSSTSALVSGTLDVMPLAELYLPVGKAGKRKGNGFIGTDFYLSCIHMDLCLLSPFLSSRHVGTYLDLDLG